MTAATRRQHYSGFWSAYGRNRYCILFFTLLLMLLVFPLAKTLDLPQAAIKGVFAACLLAAIMPNASKRSRLALFLAAGALIVTRLASDYGYLPVNSALPVVLVGATGLAAAAGALRFAISSESVNRETVYASLSTYLLAGLFFGQIYWGIETALPNSFSGPDPFSEVAAVYYSFVTLATLGYGDFLPRTDLTRGIATFEVIGGQLYLAALVARLIGIFQPADPDTPTS